MAHIVLEGLAALGEAAPGIAAASFGALALASLDRGWIRGRRRGAGALSGSFAFCALGLGLWLAIDIAWLCDDAFISFRYAANLAGGDGLVFNPGEWVEGYTNFLWTAALGGVGRLGGEIPAAALVGDLAAYAVAVLAIALAVRRASPAPAVVPFAAIAFALTRPVYTFATSGLETMPATALAALGLLASTTRRAPLASGLLLTLAALTRPDQALLVGAMGVAFVAEDLIHDRRLHLRRYLEFSAPFVLVFMPYFAARAYVYGDLFPNTYYAKSGGESYLYQGFDYLAEFLMSSGGWVFLPLFLLVIFGRSRSREDTRFRVFAFVSCLLLGGYVVKVGGDFMEHRFFVPLLPGIAAATEVTLRHRLGWLRPAARRALLLLAALAWGATVVPVHLIEPGTKRWLIAEEATFYPLSSLVPPVVDSAYVTRARSLHEAFAARGHRPRIGDGCVGMLAYYSDLPVFDAYGLTSPRVARRRVETRGRPGHEKHAVLEDYLAERVDLTFFPLFPAHERLLRVRVGAEPMFLVQWSEELIRALEAAKIRTPDVERYIAHLPKRPTREAAVDDLAFLETFLARHPERDRLLRRRREELGSIAELECALPPGSSLGEGLAFESSAPRPPGASGRCWLASDREGRGEAEIALGTLTRPTLRFALGGTQSRRSRVELRIKGRSVRTAAPAGDAALSPVVWDVAEHRGSVASLVVIDDDRDGRILIDSIHAGADPSAELAEAESLDAAELAERLRWLLPDFGESVPEPLFPRRLVRRFRFDEARYPAGAILSGDAFGDGPVAGARGAQQPVTGYAGTGLVNTFRDSDEATGRLEIPLVGFEGGAVSFLVGGGADCSVVMATVEVDGRAYGRACGKNAEALSPAMIRVPPLAPGARASFVVEDRGRGPWAHILVDDVLVVIERRATDGGESQSPQ